MKNSFVIGIDPGLKGGIAILSHDRSFSFVGKLPVLAGEMDVCCLADMINENCKDGKVNTVVIEKIIPMPRQSAVSSTTAGVNYGALIGMLKILRYGYMEIQPFKWKKAIGLVLQKDKNVDQSLRKKMLKEIAINEARKLFPQHEIKKTHDGLAESLLIAEYGRRLVFGIQH